MGTRINTLEELIKAAAKPYPELWRNGELNLGALQRHYERHGHAVSGASFSRTFSGKQTPGDHLINATHAVFDIPKSMLRGEPMSADNEKLLARYKVELSTLFLAERLEKLPKDDYYLISKQIELAEEKVKKLQEAIESSGVVPIDRHRRK